jgi:hypothetical protein
LSPAGLTGFYLEFDEKCEVRRARSYRRGKTCTRSFSIRLCGCDDRWTRPMSITWLSSDLGASKCYRDGDKARPPSDTPVISSDPGPSSTSRLFIYLLRGQRSPKNVAIHLFFLRNRARQPPLNKKIAIFESPRRSRRRDETRVQSALSNSESGKFC